MNRPITAKKHQTGIALFVCLVILLILSLLGISAMRMMTSQNMISSSSQGADLAFDAAETAISQALVDAQTAVNTSGALPAVVIGGSKVIDARADKKGITSTKVTITVPAPEDMSDAARYMVLEKITSAGALGPSIQPNLYRFSATSQVSALDISTTHVQDAIIFTLKN